jgi:hypothetical protein
VLVDTDPAFTQVRHLTEPSAYEIASCHTCYFSFAENINNPTCTIPSDGFPWKPTRQPSVVDAWELSSPLPSAKWTTVMQWNSYKSREYKGQFFGMKSHSFKDFEDLPKQIPHEDFELILDASASLITELKELGWHIQNSINITKTPWTYQQYIRQSKGEWSVAKQGFVSSNSGWFSERSLCYMATGRPVLVQDTGFTQLFETGNGLFAFKTKEEAIESMERINKNYHFFCSEARKFVQNHFEATQVLKHLLERIS